MARVLLYLLDEELVDNVSRARTIDMTRRHRFPFFILALFVAAIPPIATGAYVFYGEAITEFLWALAFSVLYFGLLAIPAMLVMFLAGVCLVAISLAVAAIVALIRKIMDRLRQKYRPIRSGAPTH